MKNKTKILIGSIITVVIVTFLITGGLIFKSVDTLLSQNEIKTPKKDYIAFLKKHEQEMVDYVISENPKVTSVQWDWDSVEVGDIGNGLPWGGGKTLRIHGKFNEIENSSFYFRFNLDESQGKDIDYKSMTVSTLRVGGKSYE